MEKEHQPDSMATITMKPDYPPSEVYSASEPPPAYRQRVSSSVQIARIAAFTIVASSLILGSFILASSWVSARASCQQLDQLDAMLDKELALEGRAYGNDALLPNEPLPLSAHALHADPPQDTLVAPEATVPVSKPVSEAQSQVKKDILNQAETKIDENKLQKVDDSKSEKTNSDSDESSDSDSSTEEEDDIDAMRPMFKLPIQFDLDELAGAFLANSQKGRMNCVVEKRHEDPMERQFPFNILGAFAPRGPQTERIAIICHGGDESRPVVPEPQSQVFAFPLSGPVRLPIRPHPDRDGPAPNNGPVSPFAALGQNRPMPFPLPMPWDSSEEQMTPPREMRIHVQRVIAIPAPHNMPPQPESMGPFSPPQAIDQNEQSVGAIIHQFVPQPAPTQELEQPQEQQKVATEQIGLPWGLTPEDLQNIIHRATEDSAAALASQNREQQIDNDMQEVKTIVNTLAAAAAEEAAAEAQSRVEQQKSDEVQAQPLMMHPAEQSPRQARTLLLPQDMGMDERPHYVQPRSVRSVDSLLHREKRMKRCACECA